MAEIELFRYLLVLNFDGTIADTFALNPNRIGVKEAYCMAIKDLFGYGGLECYNESGGLRNRNPGEVVCSLVSQGFGSEVTAEDLVQKKLSYLLQGICPKWPKPCRGFRQFYREIEGMDGVEVAILSSNHEKFVRKTFSVWGLDSPQIMLTDDDFRGFNPPLPLKQFSKPSPHLMDLIQHEWGGKRHRMMMFGDDSEKEGELAQNAGVPFGHFSSENNPFLENSIQFNSWRRISDFLKKKTSQELISQGLPVSEIIFANIF